MDEVGPRLRHRRGGECLATTPKPPLILLTHNLDALAHRHPVRDAGWIAGGQARLGAGERSRTVFPLLFRTERVGLGWKTLGPFHPPSPSRSKEMVGLDGRLCSLRILRRPILQRRGLDSGGWLCSPRTLRRPLLQRNRNTSRTHTVYFGTTLLARETCRCKRYGLKNDLPRGVRHAIVIARF